MPRYWQRNVTSRSEQYQNGGAPRLGKPLAYLTRMASSSSTNHPRPRNPPDVRIREYLTDDEVHRLIDAAKSSRYGHRDGTISDTIYLGAAASCWGCRLWFKKATSATTFAMSASGQQLTSVLSLPCPKSKHCWLKSLLANWRDG